MRRKQSIEIVLPENFDILRDFGAERLQALGASILAWNRIEHLVDQTLTDALKLDSRIELEITSRINGFDGKVAIIKAVQRAVLEISPTALRALGDTWGALEEYKRYRDGIAHAIVVNTSDPIARSAQRRGKRDEVLITTEALEALYVRLTALTHEMERLWATVYYRSLARERRNDASWAEQRKEYQRSFQNSLARYLRYQKRRLLLPPLPQFPEVSEPSLEMQHRQMLKLMGFPEDVASTMAQSITGRGKKHRKKP